MKRGDPIARRTPLKRTPFKQAEATLWKSGASRKPGDDPAYRKWINTLPCVICVRWIGTEIEPLVLEASGDGRFRAECAHVGVRGFGQRCSDRQTIPLCSAHHRTGKDSHHGPDGGKNFWTVHSLDREAIISALQSFWKILHQSS